MGTGYAANESAVPLCMLGSGGLPLLDDGVGNAFWLEGVLNLLCSGTFPIKRHYHTYKG